MIRRTVTLLVALSILVPAAASACAMYYEPAPKLVAKKAEPAKAELVKPKVEVPDPNAVAAATDEPQKIEPVKIEVEDGAGLAALMADLDGLLEPSEAPADEAAVADPAPEAPTADADADPAAKAPQDKARQAPRKAAKPASVAQR